MATVYYDTTDSYVEVTQVGTDKDFIMQSKHRTRGADVVFADAAPSASDPCHYVEPGGTLIRAGVSGKVYVKSSTPGAPVRLAVSSAV